MVQRLRRRQGGFTLIELLIVVAIIGIIAALLIPNFLDALQKAKQKRTVADMRNIGTAEMSWLTDQLAAAAAGAASTTWDSTPYTNLSSTALASLLVSQYIQQIPQKDGWKHDYWYGKNTNLGGSQVFAIASGGRDAADTGYTIPGSATTGPFDPTDYNQDIIWSDGFFVRWPQKVTS